MASSSRPDNSVCVPTHRKQESLLRDASYNGDDERRLQRARFCRHIMHLCSLIRRRHQELQQIPDDGLALPQPHQQHLGSNDHVMLNSPATVRVLQLLHVLMCVCLVRRFTTIRCASTFNLPEPDGG